MCIMSRITTTSNICRPPPSFWIHLHLLIFFLLLLLLLLLLMEPLKLLFLQKNAVSLNPIPSHCLVVLTTYRNSNKEVWEIVLQ